MNPFPLPGRPHVHVWEDSRSRRAGNPFCPIHMTEETELHDEEIPDGPAAHTVFPWLRCNLGVTALAPLTGTDHMALRAAVQVIELYQQTGDTPLLHAFRYCVRQMQRKCRQLAYHAIAHVANWEDRAHWWDHAGLWDHCDFRPETVVRCKYEPKPRLRPIA